MAIKSSRSRSTKNAGNFVKPQVSDYEVSNKNVAEEVKQQEEEVRDEQNVEVSKDSGREDFFGELLNFTICS